MEFKLQSIGSVKRNDEKIWVEVDEKFKTALTALDKFSHIQVIWWADRMDDPEKRSILVTELPYAENTKAGVFACRSEYRPNPVAVTVCPVDLIDMDKGVIYIKGIDAMNNSPLIDIKPYIPVCDRVDNSIIPEWFTGWPQVLPETGLQLEY